MTVINNRGSLNTDPIRNFRFLVSFAPVLINQQPNEFVANLGFASVSGLSVNVESIPYREGGYNTVTHQIPGQASFTPLTLSRGLMLGTGQNWKWMQRLFSPNSYPQVGTAGFRVNMTIYVLAHPRTSTNLDVGFNYAIGAKAGETISDNVHAKFTVFNAWPTSVAYSDLSAGDSGLMVEQMTLVHEGFTMALATDFNASVKTA